MQWTPCHGKRLSRQLGRLMAAAMLAAFAVAQPWVVCLPLCQLQGHAMAAMATARHQGQVAHCHSADAIRSGLPTAQSLGTSLPGLPWVTALTAFRVVALDFTPPAAVHLRPMPSADPPPPRSL